MGAYYQKTKTGVRLFLRKGFPFLLLTSLVFTLCTKPRVHYLRPTILVTADSRELFGCRINGKPFSPKAIDSASLGLCSYTGEAYRGDSGAVFQIRANRLESSCSFFTVSIILDSVLLKSGETYKLGSPGFKKNHGSYFMAPDCSQPAIELYTSDDLPGTIMITKFDKNKKIVTGTFDFKVKDKYGGIYRMSDGVFDRHYK